LIITKYNSKFIKRKVNGFKIWNNEIKIKNQLDGIDRGVSPHEVD